MTPSAVLVSQPELDRWCDSRLFLGFGKGPYSPHTIDRIDECHGVLADNFFCLEAQYPLYRRTDIADGTISLENGDDVRGVLNQRTESFLASSECVLHLLALGDVTSDAFYSHHIALRVVERVDLLFGPEHPAVSAYPANGQDLFG